jgi:peptidoglycan L-alanyl-D-glutamate endopeptidase CwlK
MDKITLDRIELLHPALREEAKQIYAEICERLTGRATCRFAYTLRTFAEQDALYNQKPKVTKAKGGQSYHNYGLAVDIVLLLNDGKSASWDTVTDFDGDGLADWQEAVYVFGLFGWDWGGNWKTFPDKPHFQKTFGLTISECLNRHNSGQVIGGTNYIKLYQTA